jgi:hypothetical protein
MGGIVVHALLLRPQSMTVAPATMAGSASISINANAPKTCTKCFMSFLISMVAEAPLPNGHHRNH